MTRALRTFLALSALAIITPTVLLGLVVGLSEKHPRPVSARGVGMSELPNTLFDPDAYTRPGTPRLKTSAPEVVVTLGDVWRVFHIANGRPQIHAWVKPHIVSDRASRRVTTLCGKALAELTYDFGIKVPACPECVKRGAPT